MDCAVSNSRTSHKNFLDVREPSLRCILEAIIAELSWVVDLEQEYPGRFLYFFEYDMGPDTLSRMADFLEVEATARWIQDALKCYQLKAPYAHSLDFIQFYSELIERYFESRPRIVDKFTKFAEPGHYRDKPLRPPDMAKD
jgi:hypothetical protein